MKKKTGVKTLKFEVIPEHKDYKLDMGAIQTTKRGYIGLLKETCFKPITLKSNDTITTTFTINYEEPLEEKNQIKIWLNNHLRWLDNLRYKISILFWDNWE